MNVFLAIAVDNLSDPESAEEDTLDANGTVPKQPEAEMTRRFSKIGTSYGKPMYT